MDYTQRIFTLFDQITKIPHGSFHEQQLSDWVVEFAKVHQLRYVQDEMGNVVIYKEASAHQEKPPVLLQAHLDMVCEKEAGLDFDFMTDSLNTYVEEGWLKAKGTTLGADDGVGVAMMLAILEDSSAIHPALECVFTVQEETGLTGSMNLKKEYFSAKQMINMDCGGEDKTVVSTAGGQLVTLTKKSAKQNNTWPCYKVKVEGLLGGHSGGNIDKERGNANKIVTRCLKAMIQNGISIRLVDWQGGNKDNAIPRDAWMVFVSNSDSVLLQTLVDNTTSEIRAELQASDPDLHVKLSVEKTIDQAESIADSINLLNFLTILPTGVRAKSLAIEGLTWASENCAAIKSTQEDWIITVSLRSAQRSWINTMTEELSILAQQFGWVMKTSNSYPAWDFQPQSKMRKKLAEVVKQRSGNELKIEAGHGGTECGVFSELIEGIDIVTLCPLAQGAHTPQEMLNLASFERTYDLLKDFLSKL